MDRGLVTPFFIFTLKYFLAACMTSILLAWTIPLAEATYTPSLTAGRPQEKGTCIEANHIPVSIPPDPTDLWLQGW